MITVLPSLARAVCNVAFLVAKSGNHVLALSLDAPDLKPAESMRPALESLMRSIIARPP